MYSYIIAISLLMANSQTADIVIYLLLDCIIPTGVTSQHHLYINHDNRSEYSPCRSPQHSLCKVHSSTPNESDLCESSSALATYLGMYVRPLHVGMSR